MPDPSNQQILDAISNVDRRLQGVENRLGGVEGRLDGMATKDDLKKLRLGLERKIQESQDINVKHFLEVRADIGGLNTKFLKMEDRQDTLEQDLKSFKTGVAQAASVGA